MTTFEKACAIYQSEPCARTLREDLEAHLLHGMVYSTPKAFIMARYVSRRMSDADIVNPWISEPTGLADCIHIYLAAGDLTQFFTFPHDPVKWISFERENQLRFYPYATLLQRCTKTSKAHSGALI